MPQIHAQHTPATPKQIYVMNTTHSKMSALLTNYTHCRHSHPLPPPPLYMLRLQTPYEPFPVGDTIKNDRRGTSNDFRPCIRSQHLREPAKFRTEIPEEVVAAAHQNLWTILLRNMFRKKSHMLQGSCDYHRLGKFCWTILAGNVGMITYILLAGVVSCFHLMLFRVFV